MTTTFEQLLRVAFWLHPVQRVLTLAGAATIIVAILGGPRLGSLFLPGTTLPLLFAGVALMLVLPLLLGGAWLRMLSAPRQIQLLPHARRRLLTGTLMILLLGTLLWLLAYWLSFRGLPLRYRPGPEGYALMYMLTLNFATQCLIAAFVASRGPLWTLVMLLLWAAPHPLLPLLGVQNPAEVLAGPVGVAIVAVALAVFSAWYLTARRIGGQGWTRGSVGAAALAASEGEEAARLTSEVALTRWLLGSGTPLSMTAQWTLCVAVLVGVQLLFGYDSPPATVAAVAYGTLSCSALVIATVGYGVAARSRPLWLMAGRDRRELFLASERLLLGTAAAILLPFLLIGAVLWGVLPQRPALTPLYLAAAILAPGISAIWFGLALVRRSGVVDVAAGLAILAGWYYGLARPLATGSGPVWASVAALLVLAVALRSVAAARWRSLDWPRRTRLSARVS